MSPKTTPTTPTRVLLALTSLTLAALAAAAIGDVSPPARHRLGVPIQRARRLQLESIVAGLHGVIRIKRREDADRDYFPSASSKTTMSLGASCFVITTAEPSGVHVRPRGRTVTGHFSNWRNGWAAPGSAGEPLRRRLKGKIDRIGLTGTSLIVTEPVKQPTAPAALLRPTTARRWLSCSTGSRRNQSSRVPAAQAAPSTSSSRANTRHRSG